MNNNPVAKHFSWLHLTDLHFGIKEQRWLWPGMREEFFEDLKRLHDKCGPWDLVLFTGDLTQEGTAEEFQKLDELLERLWEHFGHLGSSPALLAVPGNHDLVRPDEERTEVILLNTTLSISERRSSRSDRPKTQTKFWNDAKSQYRKVVDKAFENYVAWWENQPSRRPGCGSMIF